jgi:hypothetical protein
LEDSTAPPKTAPPPFYKYILDPTSDTGWAFAQMTAADYFKEEKAKTDDDRKPAATETTSEIKTAPPNSTKRHHSKESATSPAAKKPRKEEDQKRKDKSEPSNTVQKASKASGQVKKAPKTTKSPKPSKKGSEHPKKAKLSSQPSKVEEVEVAILKPKPHTSSPKVKEVQKVKEVHDAASKLFLKATKGGSESNQEVEPGGKDDEEMNEDESITQAEPEEAVEADGIDEVESITQVDPEEAADGHESESTEESLRMPQAADPEPHYDDVVVVEPVSESDEEMDFDIQAPNLDH